MNHWPGVGHQSDPLHPALTRSPFWITIALGIVGAVVLLGFVAYALLA
jgi:hypothetical protein